MPFVDVGHGMGQGKAVPTTPGMIYSYPLSTAYLGTCGWVRSTSTPAWIKSLFIRRPTQRLALPTHAATYEPKRLRLRILAVAARIVRTARRRLLKIDPAWPWADTLTTAYTRLTALPAP